MSVEPYRETKILPKIGEAFLRMGIRSSSEMVDQREITPQIAWEVSLIWESLVRLFGTSEETIIYYRNNGVAPIDSLPNQSPSDIMQGLK